MNIPFNTLKSNYYTSVYFGWIFLYYPGGPVNIHKKINNKYDIVEQLSNYQQKG